MPSPYPSLVFNNKISFQILFAYYQLLYYHSRGCNLHFLLEKSKKRKQRLERGCFRQIRRATLQLEFGILYVGKVACPGACKPQPPLSKKSQVAEIPSFDCRDAVVPIGIMLYSIFLEFPSFDCRDAVVPIGIMLYSIFLENLELPTFFFLE